MAEKFLVFPAHVAGIDEKILLQAVEQNPVSIMDMTPHGESISYEIVRSHDRWVSIESQLGGGSSYTIAPLSREPADGLEQSDD